jgi:hypothetical protein
MYIIVLINMSLLCCYVIIMLCIVTFAPGPGAERTQHGSLLCFFLFFFLSRLCLNLFYTRFSHSILCPEPVLVNDLLHQMYIDDNNDDFNDRNGNVIMYIIMLLCYVQATGATKSSALSCHLLWCGKTTSFLAPFCCAFKRSCCQDRLRTNIS